MTITLCASASHYREVLDIQEALERNGHTVLLPNGAQRMKESGDYSVTNYKPWLVDSSAYAQKRDLMQGHFEKVIAGDATLVVNLEKNGLKGYIGGNVLMEMALAFYAGKPIYLLNEIDEALPVKEEVLGLMPIVLHGDVGRI